LFPEEEVAGFELVVFEGVDEDADDDDDEAVDIDGVGVGFLSLSSRS